MGNDSLGLEGIRRESMKRLGKGFLANSPFEDYVRKCDCKTLSIKATNQSKSCCFRSVYQFYISDYDGTLQRRSSLKGQNDIRV